MWQPTARKITWAFSLIRLLESHFLGLDWRYVLLLEGFVDGLDIFERLGVVFFSLKNRLLPSK